MLLINMKPRHCCICNRILEILILWIFLAADVQGKNPFELDKSLNSVCDSKIGTHTAHMYIYIYVCILVYMRIYVSITVYSTIPMVDID